MATAEVLGQVNVLHVIETLDVGGAEGVVVDLANHFSDRFRSTICCLKRSGPMASRLRPGVEVIELGKEEGNDWGIPGRLARILRERRIHVLQSHNWAVFCESVAAGMLVRTPVRVHLQHGESAPPPAGLCGRLKRGLRFRVEEVLSRAGLHALVAVSEEVKSSLLRERRIPAGWVRVIRNGISLEPARTDQRTQKRREWGLSPDAFVVMAVGRLAAIKNHALLVRAFARALPAAGRPAALVIAGDGAERPSLERLIEERGLRDHVRLLGVRRDVRDLLLAADVFAVSSLSEGISVALLEAMAAGLPAVATRVGGNAEVVADGETGLLVETGQEDPLARALLTLLGDETVRRRMGEAGRRRVERFFDLKKTVGAFEALYLEVLGRAA